MEATLQQEIQFLIAASSDSQKAYKQLQHEVDQHHSQQGDYTANSIATIRASTSGQEGLTSFFEKRKPSWFRQIPNGTELFKKPN